MHNLQHLETISFFKALIQEGDVQRYLASLRTLQSGDTYGHSFRVGQLSVDIGYDNNLLDWDLSILGLAGILHDIGKSEVDEAILMSTGRLDEDQIRAMQGHPRLGFILLEDYIYRPVRQIVVAHHEFKNNPYPRTGNDRRQKGARESERRQTEGQIETLAQIVAVSDMFDALTSQRGYKEPLPMNKVEEILRYQYQGDQMYVDQVLLRAA